MNVLFRVTELSMEKCTIVGVIYIYFRVIIMLLRWMKYKYVSIMIVCGILSNSYNYADSVVPTSTSKYRLPCSRFALMDYF